ncbi:MAG TPA: GH116 family glycosyl hydrolase [Sphingobacteriaceae bacterium]
MIRPLFFLALVLSSALSFAQKTSPSDLRIGLVNAGSAPEEIAAASKFLSAQPGIQSRTLSIENLRRNTLRNSGLTHIWIHKIATEPHSRAEIAAGTALKEFVRQGGNLILSMDAVSLLNKWGIEKNTFEVKSDSVKDEGFGRPLGFHAFKTHPVFEGLHGGAYPWKGKTDHVIRKTGFFGQNLPDTSIAKVIGIEWTYITYHEQNKLVFEYPFGKGKIIAIGAYSYFAPENFNTLQLHRFYQNVFRYMAGRIKDIQPRYWNYAAQKVLPLTHGFPHTGIIPTSKWTLPKLTLEIDNKKAGSDFVSLAGRRMLVMGKQKGGIDEIWSHPFMSFRDVHAGVILKGADSIIWLQDTQPSINVSPEMLIRNYTLNGITLKEVTTVSADKPIAVVHYEWDSDRIEKVVMKYTSNFRYMWPYSEKASGSIKHAWEPRMNAVVSSAQDGDLAAMMGFSSRPAQQLVGQYQGFSYSAEKLNGMPTDLVQLSGIFTFDASEAKGALSAYLVAGNEGLNETLNLYQQESKSFDQLFSKSSQYIAKLLDNSLVVTSPDEHFNTGYKWALARTDQFFQETPGLGTSLMAGFGTTARGWGGGQKISGRPGYAWYFGRDAQWSGMAINAYGGHEMVKKTLDVFVRYQDLTGKIYHELTSSGALHYDASDATPLYVVLAAHYLKQSGDLEYIRKIWPSLKKAMDFCYSTDTDQDGLIEITNVGHGWIEGGPLFGAHTEIYLAGSWVAALDAASYMAGALNDQKLAGSYSTDASKVRNIIDKDFWNEKGQYFSNGKMRDGSFMQEETMLTSVPVYFDAITDPQKARKTMASYARNEYSTDWGMRILPEGSSLFNPTAYHAGMVWPLFSGLVSLAEYKTGDYTSAYTHMMNNLLLYRDYGLGSAEETLNGLTYKPAGVCTLQGWSETMVLQPVSEGMLGLRPDALAGRIAISPMFPWNWQEAQARNISFGKHRFHMDMKRNPQSTNYMVSGGNGFDMLFSPALLFGTDVRMVLVNGKPVDFSVNKQQESIQLQLPLIPIIGETTIEIRHDGGIGVLPLVNIPNPGDPNQGAKIIGQELKGNNYQVSLEGRPGKEYSFQVMSNKAVSTVSNGAITSVKGNIYTIGVTIPQAGSRYAEQTVSIHFKPEPKSGSKGAK